MSLISKLLGFDKVVKKAFSLQTRFVQIGYSSIIHIGADAETLFRKAFEENIIYYSIIDRIAEKFGHLPRYVYNKTETKKNRGKIRTKALDENISDGELMELLLHPNEHQGQDQFFYLAGLSYKTCGETIIWKNRGGLEKGKPVELYVLPPWLVSVVPDGTLHGIKEYILQLSGQMITFPKEDVIHWKKPALSLNTATWDHLRGFNPLIPQRQAIEQSTTIMEASTAMYENGGARGVLVNTGLEDLTPEQNDKLDSVVDRKINGGPAKQAVVQVQGQWSYIDLGGSSVDMQLIEADSKLIEKICFALGFPPELYRSDSTFANKEQAFVFYITNTLMPMAASFDGELTRSLSKDFKDFDFIATDFDELPEMQKQRLEKVKSMSELWQLTGNQVLELGGFEKSKLPEMDKIFIKQGLIPIEESSIGEPIETENQNLKDYGA